MKRILSLVFVLSLTVAAFAAAPSAPSGAFVSGLTTVPTTNAISAPFGFFPAAIVYNASTIFTPATSTMFKWNANTELDLNTYEVNYGQILLTNVFNTLTVPKTVNGIIFTGLSTNAVYGFYVTAINTSAQESLPSTLVVLKPGTP